MSWSISHHRSNVVIQRLLVVSKNWRLAMNPDRSAMVQQPGKKKGLMYIG